MGLTRRNWNDDEREIMKENFPHTYTNNICEMLSRSYKSVTAQASLMGLKKSKAFMKMELERQAYRLKTSGEAYRYSKGNIPANKGLKMPKEVYQKCKSTMFKKGCVPHNTKFNGHERLNKNGYIVIRIKKGKYVLKHRHIWEQINGKIPNGMIVDFKDKNPQNLKLENLELISQQENMVRNSINRFPEELKNTIHLVNKLKRKIYAQEQN